MISEWPVRLWSAMRKVLVTCMLMDWQASASIVHFFSVFIISIFETVDRCCGHHLRWQSAPAFYDTLTERIFSDIQSESFLWYLQLMSASTKLICRHVEELVCIYAFFSRDYLLCVD
jgi:hypothetical protein